jgi:hypothetical protein
VKIFTFAKLAIKIKLISLNLTLKLKSILSFIKRNKGVSAKLILVLSLIDKEANKLLKLVKKVHLIKKRKGLYY